MAVKKTEIDMRKLERDLQKFGKKFGDSTSQAVTRWGVQVCRELGKDTWARGKKKQRGSEEKGIGARKQQNDAIMLDALNIMLVVDRATPSGNGYKVTNQGKTYRVSAGKFLSSPAEVNAWIKANRKGRRRRTRKLAIYEKRVTTKATLKQALDARKKASGEAKGAWVNAGRKLAQAQTGPQRVTIASSFLAYAADAAKGSGSASIPKKGYNPSTTLENPIRHSKDSEVLSKRDIKNAIQWGLKKTLTWYKMAMRPKKSKP